MPETVEVLNELKPRDTLRVGQITVGATTSKALTSSCTSKSVGLLPHSANTGKVYFGYSSAVTTSNGCELSVPTSLSIDNANKIHVIANQASQKVCWVVLR